MRTAKALTHEQLIELVDLVQALVYLDTTGSASAGSPPKNGVWVSSLNELAGRLHELGLVPR